MRGIPIGEAPTMMMLRAVLDVLHIPFEICALEDLGLKAGGVS